GQRLQHVAKDGKRALREERDEHCGVGIRHQLHVGLIDHLPAGDRGTVEHDAFGEGVLIHHLRVHGDVLHLSARVGETQVHELDFVILDFLRHTFSVCHRTPLSFLPLVLEPSLSSGGQSLNRPALCRSARPSRQMASFPVSPVRMRTASSTFDTKIFPSPMRPVLAEAMMASMAFSTMVSPSTSSSFTLGRKSTTYSAPR